MPYFVGMVGNGNGWEWVLGVPNMVLAVASGLVAVVFLS